MLVCLFFVIKSYCVYNICHKYYFTVFIKIMKFFLIVQFLILSSFLFSESLRYKSINDNEENANYFKLKYPNECEKILDIKKSKIYEFKDKKRSNKIFTQCSIYVKGKNVKESVKVGSSVVVKTGEKVKDGLVKGTNIVTESLARETEYIMDDTIKLKDSIVKGTGNIIGKTISTGNQVKEGVSSFFKGILSASD